MPFSSLNVRRVGKAYTGVCSMFDYGTYLCSLTSIAESTYFLTFFVICFILHKSNGFIMLQNNDQKIDVRVQPTLDDNSVLEDLMQSHDVLLSAFRSRLTKLQVPLKKILT